MPLPIVGGSAWEDFEVVPFDPLVGKRIRRFYVQNRVLSKPQLDL